MIAHLPSNPRDRRALMIGIGAVGLLLAVRGAPAYLRWTTEVAASAQAQSDRLTYAHRAIVALPAMKDSTLALRRRLEALDGRLLGSGSPSRIASDLSAIVTGAARDAGLDVVAASAIADTARSTPFASAEVRLDAQGDVSGILQFLLLLELAPGLLEVRELSLSQGEPAAPPTQPEALRLTIRVSGVARRARALLATEGGVQ